MKRRHVYCLAALLVLVLLPLAGCAKVESTTHSTVNPATVERIGDTGISRLTLTEKAAQRLGIRTFPVISDVDGRIVIPYAALMYQPNGSTFVYTNPEGTSYVRAPVTVETISGEKVVLTSGPPVGTAVVTTGGAELWGTEFKIGKY